MRQHRLSFFRTNGGSKIPALVAFLCAALLPVSGVQAGCSPDAPLGQLCWTAATYCPENYAQAKGQTLAKSEYQALATLLGDNFGNSTAATFQLPDLQGRTMIGWGDRPGLEPVKLGQQTGASTLTLSPNQMPPHVHRFTTAGQAITGTLKANKDEGAHPQPGGRYPAGFPVSQSPPYYYGSPIPDTSMTGPFGYAGISVSGHGETSSTGSGTEIETVAPRIGLTPCIVITAQSDPDGPPPGGLQ
ncbi:MAG: phage tail protein [Magnetovibrionaceae bacterium]